MTRRLIALALAWSLLAAPATAHELVVTHVERDLARATERLARLTQPTPATMLSDVEVHQHFERALSDHLVGEHTRAAERFYALEPYVRDASLRQEVQWYRAETLLAADLPNLAEQALDSILADPTHPYHPRALEEAMRLAGERRQPERLVRLAEAAPPQPGATQPQLSYTLGRAWLQLGKHDHAVAALRAVPAEAPDYPRARYVLGAAHTAAGRIREAEAAFGEAMGPTAPPAVAARARLALARLAHHRGDLDTAAWHYAALDLRSGLLAEALHELAWVYVAADKPMAAVATIDHFLEAFPDHAAAGSLGAARGRLLHKAGEEERAEEAYAAVEAMHLPLVDTLDSATAEEAAHWILGATRVPDTVPAWAQQRLARPRAVRSSLDSRSHLERTREALEQGQSLSDALAAVDPAQEQDHSDQRAVAAVLLEVARGLLSAAEAHINAPSAPHDARSHRRHHEALERELQQTEAGSHDLDAVRALLSHVEAHRSAVRAAGVDEHHDLATQRLDELVMALHDSRSSAEAWLATPRAAPPPAWRGELARCTEALHEARLEAQRLDQVVDETLHDAVASAVHQAKNEADAQLEAALAGLADVTWARLTATGDARDTLIGERDEQVHALEALFEVASAR